MQGGVQRLQTENGVPPGVGSQFSKKSRLAVVVARLADIFKVLPGVAAAERLPGAWGVAMDDVVAGVYGLGAGIVVAFVW